MISEIHRVVLLGQVGKQNIFATSRQAPGLLCLLRLLWLKWSCDIALLRRPCGGNEAC